MAALLAGQGASVRDLAWVVIYLRSAGSRAQLDRVLRRRSWPLDVPLTVVEAAVCRPEWLVEIEGLAVRPA